MKACSIDMYSPRLTRVIAICIAAGLMIGVQLARAADDEHMRRAIEQQRINKQLFDDLTAQMLTLGELLEKNDPEAAKAIHEALKAAQQAFISQDMDQVAELLRRGLSASAGTKEAQIVQNLNAVLDALRRGASDATGLDDIERMKQYLRALNELSERQLALSMMTERSARDDELKRRLKELMSGLGVAIESQRGLMSQTKNLQADPHLAKLTKLRDALVKLLDNQISLDQTIAQMPFDRFPLAATSQQRLAERAMDSVGQLDSACQDEALVAAIIAAGAKTESIYQAREHVRESADEMTTCAVCIGRYETAAFSQANEQACYDLRQAIDSLSQVIERMLDADPAGNVARLQRQLARDIDNLASSTDEMSLKLGVGSDVGNLSEAAGMMSDSADQITRQNPLKAVEQQQRAVELLQQASRYQLAQIQRKLQEPVTDTNQQQTRQSELLQNARELANEMREELGLDAPGSKGVGASGEQMAQASKSLARNDEAAAHGHQLSALDMLARAQDELAEAINRIEKVTQDEQIEAIEQALARILDNQTSIAQRTRETWLQLLDARDTAPPRVRVYEQTLRVMAGQQKQLADDVKQVRDMLLGEGRSTVFPGALEQVDEQMCSVATRLGEALGDTGTQQAQRRIVRMLQAMIDAIRERLGEGDQSPGAAGGGQGDGGGGERSLLPPLAELKLLRMMQIQLNERTAEVDRLRQEGRLDDADNAIGKLTRDSSTIRKLAERMRDRIEQSRHQGGEQ